MHEENAPASGKGISVWFLAVWCSREFSRGCWGLAECCWLGWVERGASRVSAGWHKWIQMLILKSIWNLWVAWYSTRVCCLLIYLVYSPSIKRRNKRVQCPKMSFVLLIFIKKKSALYIETWSRFLFSSSWSFSVFGFVHAGTFFTWHFLPGFYVTDRKEWASSWASDIFWR